MRFFLRILIGGYFLLSFSSCVTVPKESITLSKTLGNDLQSLHNSHRNMVLLHYSEIKTDINTFIDEVYSPFVIHRVLKSELENYKQGKLSIYKSIVDAGENGGKEETDFALKEMTDFQKATNFQINKKRKELLTPIIKQEREVILKIDRSYNNIIYANTTITAYLESAADVKESQRKASSMIGLDADEIDASLLEISDVVNEYIEKGKEIDIKSDDALKQFDELSKKIKEVTNKN